MYLQFQFSKSFSLNFKSILAKYWSVFRKVPCFATNSKQLEIKLLINTWLKKNPCSQCTDNLGLSVYTYIHHSLLFFLFIKFILYIIILLQIWGWSGTKVIGEKLKKKEFYHLQELCTISHIGVRNISQVNKSSDSKYLTNILFFNVLGDNKIRMEKEIDQRCKCMKFIN